MIAALNDTVTIAAAARRAAMSPNGLRHWIRKGRVETIPTPLGRVVVMESLEEFLRDRQNRAAGELIAS